MTLLRVLTGDTPTGKLHLGHWVGSLEARVELQRRAECHFIIANTHALINRARDPAGIRRSVNEIVLDYLAAGIDPDVSAIFLQSEIPAIAELTLIFSMLITHSRLLQNPTLKEELRDKALGENYPFGFVLYPVGQAADILALKADLVPVGEDQLPLIELTREIARRFNQWYCGVSPETPDEEHRACGGVFPIPTASVGRVRRLIGTSAPDEEGRFRKMSKSLDNAIYLSDTPEEVVRKVRGLYTDPKRVRATDPGTVENNPLWIFHDAFNRDANWVADAKDLYRRGKIGDVECKAKLAEALNEFLAPMRARRQRFTDNPSSIERVLLQGTERTNSIAEATLFEVKRAMGQDLTKRVLRWAPIGE